MLNLEIFYLSTYICLKKSPHPGNLAILQQEKNIPTGEKNKNPVIYITVIQIYRNKRERQKSLF